MNQTDNHKAPVFIGPDVIVEGTIRCKDGGDPNEAAIITGVFKGNIDWPGIVHIAAGAEVVIDSKVSCREMDVAGTISGGDQNVVLETGMLRMRETATVEVGVLSLPPGGLEQERGAVVNANLRMTKEHPYASQQPQPAQSEPVLAVVSNEAPAAGGREQIPAFLTTRAQGGGTMQSGAGQVLATGTGQR